ncbi:UNVERIFIED_CONTAM: hypothetical protein RMT77_014991 [Armadillidium vulgare]
MNIKSECEIKIEELDLEYDSYQQDSQIFSDNESDITLKSEDIKIEEIDEKVSIKSELIESEKESVLNEGLVNNGVIKSVNVMIEEKGSANIKLLKMEQQQQCCIVSSLLRESFQRKSEDERRLILNKGLPTPKLSCVQIGKSTSRTFKTSWYEKYKWLCGSVDKNSLFCWPCLIISVKKNIWSNEGFKDWKNLSRALERHSTSKEHILNFLSYKKLFKKFNTIQEALNEHARLSKEEYNVNVSKNREVFKLLINLTSVLCKQELPFRGHNESKNSCNQGNFKEIFQVIINANEELKAHWEKMGAFNGLSKTIENDIIDCIASELKENIYKSISDAIFFSIQVDETIDTNEKAQYSIICRFVNFNGRVKEHFIGFYDFGEDRSAKGICQRLIEVLEPFDFRKKLVAQTYYCASVIASELNELQSYIRNYAPQAIFTHCLAHKLNLVLQNSCKKISAVKFFFSSLQGIPAYFYKSCKRTSVLDRIVGKRMPTYSEVRWNSNAKIVNAVVTERVKLIEVFKELKNSKDSKSNTVRQAEAYEAKLCDFDFIFYLLIFRDVFLETELLFNTFQKELIDIQFCINQTSICERELKNMRNEETFQNYFDAAQKETEHTDSTLRVQNNMKCMNKGYYKRIFYEILDNISQIRVRFANINSLKFLQLCNSSQFDNYNRNFPESALESLMNVYGDFFDKKNLKSELMAVYAHENKQLFHNNDIDAILKNIVENDFQETLPQAYKLFCLIATILATTASPQRSFSCLTRIKTFLRSTMTQQRLSSLAFSSIEKELLINLSNKCNWHEKIIERFSLQKEKKIDLLYKE